jgi:hypothetical protein
MKTSLISPYAQLVGGSTTTIPDLSWTSPNAVSVGSTTTSASITWNAASGGSAPYSYSESFLSFDSTGAYTASLSDVDLVTTLSGMTTGGTYILEKTVTDALGKTLTLQAAFVVAPSAATLTPGSSPANQTLSAGTLSASIGTWGAPSGGTAPYSYTLVETTGHGALILGSDLGPWGASGLTNGRSYAFLLTITDILGAKGYSVVTISIAYSVPEWEEVITVDFTDANWTSFINTGIVASALVKQATIYAADGTTPRIDIWNNSTQARELAIDPSSTGLILKTTSAAASPSVKVVVLDDTGQNVMQTLDWKNDLVKVEFLWETEEPSGSGAFSHLVGFSRLGTNTLNQHGYRLVNTGSNILSQRRSWTTSDSLVTEATITPSPSRKCQLQWEAYVTGSRTIESYGRTAASIGDLPIIPRSGSYYMHQAVSQTLASIPTMTNFADTAQGGWGFLMYVDGSAVDNGTTTLSRGTLKKIRISRIPNGSVL